jgi:LEA14-like dessication related protein
MTNRSLFAAGLLFLAACKSTPEMRADVKEAQLPKQDMQISTQSLTDVTVKLSGEILAGDEPLSISGAEVEFVVDGNVLSTKNEALSLNVAAGQLAPFSFEQTFTYVKDSEELKAMDARGGSILIALRGNLKATVQREVVAAGKTSIQAVNIELPFARSREVRTPRLPHLKLGEFEAGRFSESEVQAVFHLLVVNTNNFPVTLSGLTYEVSLAGKKVAEGTQGVGIKTAIAATDVFDVSATMNEESHGKDVKKLIKGLVVPYEVKGELKTPLYSETLASKGDIKLTVSKDK